MRGGKGELDAIAGSKLKHQLGLKGPLNVNVKLGLWQPAHKNFERLFHAGTVARMLLRGFFRAVHGKINAGQLRPWTCADS